MCVVSAFRRTTRSPAKAGHYRQHGSENGSSIEGTEVKELRGSHRVGEERRVARDSGPAQPAPHATTRRPENTNVRNSSFVFSAFSSWRDPLRGSVARCSYPTSFASPLLCFCSE